VKVVINVFAAERRLSLVWRFNAGSATDGDLVA
jgi:hypothetical protein